MPLNLTTPIQATATINSIKITSFAVDIVRKEIHVAYNELDSNLSVIAEKSISILEPDFTNTILDASSIAGTDIYVPLKTAIYNQIKVSALYTGIVI